MIPVAKQELRRDQSQDRKSKHAVCEYDQNSIATIVDRKEDGNKREAIRKQLRNWFTLSVRLLFLEVRGEILSPKVVIISVMIP